VTEVASAQSEVALLTQPEGNVLVKRGRHARKVKEDMLLDVGDVVNVNGSGTVVIYQAYTPVTRLGANQQFNVVRRFPPPPERALTSEEFTWFKVHYIAARRNRKNPSPATMGGTEDANLTLLEPRNSIALTRRPMFTWSRVPEVTKYVVSIYDKGESVVCTESTAETQLTLPDMCPPLGPGDYKWDVTAQIGDQILADSALYDATSFTVVAEQQAAEISRALEHAQTLVGGNSEALYVYVSALMESRLYPKAEIELRRALEKSPKDQNLWAFLMETYAKMKRWRAREKARELSNGDPTVEMIRALESRR
jgi:hypothetical protein